MIYYKLENISKNFKELEILKNISFELKKGEIVSFVGKSGVGKTTLFDIIAGFESATSGKIFLNNNEITNLPKNISYMMQKPLLLENLTVLQNVSLPLILEKKSKKISLEISKNILEKFQLLEHKDKYPSQLSGGMKQRISFLRAYLKKSDIMLLDEPFSALDSITKHYIYDWFKNFIEKRENTIIFITHDIKEALLFSDKIFILAGKPASISYKFEINDKESLKNPSILNQYYENILKYIE